VGECSSDPFDAGMYYFDVEYIPEAEPSTLMGPDCTILLNNGGTTAYQVLNEFHLSTMCNETARKAKVTAR
jgi:hypothetical protein